MDKIRGYNDIKSFLSSVKPGVFGVGVYAFNRLGLEEVMPSYRMVALRESLENAMMRKDGINIYAVESHTTEKSLAGKKKNSITAISHPVTRKYINSESESPLITTYKPTRKFQNEVKKNGWKLAMSDYKLGGEYLENKASFREFLSTTSALLPLTETVDIREKSFEELLTKFGHSFVLQDPNSGGGKGTIFSTSNADLEWMKQRIKEKVKEKQNPDYKVVVSKFISGPSVSVSAVATKWGTFVSNLQFQIIDIRDITHEKKGAGAGIFCGHDWTVSHGISEKSHRQAIASAKAVGEAIYKLGFRGFFGLDMMLDETDGSVYIIECNPRFTGAMPVLDMIQAKDKFPLFSSLHILEYLSDTHSIDVDHGSIQKDLVHEKKGTHFFVQSMEEFDTKLEKPMQPGVYKLNHGKAEFLRDGYKIKHMKSNDEFIVTEIPNSSAKIPKFSRVLRVLTLRNVLDAKTRKFTPWASELTKSIYSTIKLVPFN